MEKNVMRTFLVLSLVLVLSMSGCSLFFAKSTFFVENNTGVDLVVSYVGIQDNDDDPVTVSAGQTVQFAIGMLIEADAVLPSLYFRSLSIALASAPDAAVYTQDPIDDGLWESVPVDGKEYEYILSISVDDI